MNEYIERGTAMRVARHAWYKGLEPSQFIEIIHAADVVPVVHGRWKASSVLLECQNCGEIYSRLGGNGGKAWNYCPNCGASMDYKE